MYACICRAVTVSEVCAAVDAGADTLERISEATRAGTDCCGCHEHLEDILESRCTTCPLVSVAVA